MSEVTRDPRSMVLTGAGNVGVGGVVAYVLEKFAPNLSPMDVSMILTGALILYNGMGSLARDYVHELESMDPPMKAGYLIRKIATFMG